MSSFIMVVIAYTLFLLLFLAIFVYRVNKGKIKNMNDRVERVVTQSVLCGIVFNIICLLFIYIFDLRMNSLEGVFLTIACILYITHVIVICLFIKFQSNFLNTLVCIYTILNVIIVWSCVYISLKDSTYNLKGEVYEYQVSTVDCYSGLFNQNLGDIQVYYNNKGLELFQADDALTILDKKHKDIKFKDDNIEYIKAEDIYWSYNGVSYTPAEELNNLDSDLVKINITYENGELKEFIPESIELTVLNEDTVYCKATDGYATVSTAFNVK